MSSDALADRSRGDVAADLAASERRLAGALEELGVTQERARIALEAVKDHAIFTTDPQGRIDSWPPGAAALFGWTPDEAIGMSFAELFTPEDRAADVPERELATARREGCAPDERFHLRKDGTRFFVDGSTRPLHRGDGSHAGFIKVGRDDTRRRAVEAELREVAERYRLAALATNDAIWDWDLGRGRVEWNDAIEALSGYPLDRVDPSPDWWKARIHPDDRDQALSTIGRVIDGVETHWTHEYRFLHADGRSVHVFDRGAVIRDADGRAVRMVGAMHDLSARKQAEDALRRLNGSLGEQVAAEVARRMQAEEALRQSQKMEAIGQLTGGVAHDFNNLLTIIRSAADLLRTGTLPEAKRGRYVDAIADTADRAAKLTGQLLAFARRQALKPEVFDVAERIDALADMLATVAGPRIAFRFDLACRPCLVEADISQFETAVVNLVANARDAMDAEGQGEGSGEIRIALHERAGVPATRGHGAAPGRFAALSIGDTGHGIAADALPSIFEPFFTTKGVGKGTGLGLSQVYGFAKQSGGEVQVDSAEGEGATFTIFLPRSDKDLRPVRADPANADAAPRGRVLVVEDNDAVGDFSQALLREIGFEPTLVTNAADALNLLARERDRFDVVFSDVVMPGMTGVDLGHQVRARHPGLPIVLASGYSHVLAAEGTHGFELLNKPYSLRDLTDALRRAMMGVSRDAG